METKERVEKYLGHWAPHLLQDKQLMDELLEEVMEAEVAEQDPHAALHRYFVAWCAVRAATFSSEGGGGMVRRTRPREIWGNVAATDPFASEEFGDLTSCEARLAAWFDARIDEAAAILRLRLGGKADEAIEILGEWLCRGFDPTVSATARRRTLVKAVAVVREEFGTINMRPEIPDPPDGAALAAQVAAEMRKQQRRDAVAALKCRYRGRPKAERVA